MAAHVEHGTDGQLVMPGFQVDRYTPGQRTPLRQRQHDRGVSHSRGSPFTDRSPLMSG